MPMSFENMERLRRVLTIIISTVPSVALVRGMLSDVEYGKALERSEGNAFGLLVLIGAWCLICWILIDKLFWKLFYDKYFEED